jgi:hypothetical protein
VFERSELFESVRTSKRIVEMLARWEAEPSRSKSERITIKWSRAPVRGGRVQKERCFRGVMVEGRSKVERRETILMLFAGARSKTVYLFFFISNRV